MTAGITRIHGTSLAGDFRGGYQPRIFKVVPTQGDFSIGYSATATNSVFEGAVRAIENVASLVQVGVPTAAGFVVVVDGGNYYGRGDNTGYAADTSAATLKSNIEAFTAVTATVTEVVFSGITLV
jgi:hypothetical protein